MTNTTTCRQTQTMVQNEVPEISAAEIDMARREMVFGRPEHLGPEQYPRLMNISAAFTYKATLRPEQPSRPEYVTVPMRSRSIVNDQALRLEVTVARWNSLWEAAQYRRRMFDESDLPPQLHRIADQGDHNVVFVPRSRSRYYEYAPLFHLLPASTLRLFGLPQLVAGQWPFSIQMGVDLDDYLPADFEQRLSRAWAAAVWRHLLPGSPLRGFSDDDPVRLLAHNLDYWIPAVTDTVEETLRTFPLVHEGTTEQQATLVDGSALPGVLIGNPRTGGTLWQGEAEAAEVLAEVVERADETGCLRGILDAVRSNRVVDDFSNVWTYEKEDFERRLYRKRAKVKVTFVELTDTIPVQGPESQVIGDMVHGDFLALLKPKDREIVVLLSSGVTKLTEVATILGYANHSPISKRLARIRRQAEAFFNQLD